MDEVRAAAMSCRLCGTTAVPLADRGDMALYRCPRCRFVSGRPAAPEALSGSYEHTYRGPHAPDPEGRYNEWLSEAERLVGKGRLLEIGAGGGGFVRVAARRGWDTHATETSPSALDVLRRVDGATVFEGDLPRLSLPANRYDMVVAFEVVEHLASPATYLQETRRVLKEGGVLLMTTPNYDGLSRRWLGLKWRVLCPEHLGYFAPGTLRRALRAAGYGRARVRSRSLDLSTWRRSLRKDAVPAFDPHASARLRDTVESSWLLRTSKEAVNRALAVTGLGDSLLAWARP